MLLSIYPVCCYDLQEPEVLQEPFVALSSEEEDEVFERAFSANRYEFMIWLYVRRLSIIYNVSSLLFQVDNLGYPRKILIEITGKKFRCLRSTGWLNDEVNLFASLFVYPFVELLN